MKTSLKAFAILTLALAGPTIASAADCAQPTHAGLQRTSQPASANIVQTASNAGNFMTLVAAVKAAGLVDTLSGPGPFTVFAPSDSAFAALPHGTVDDLLKPQNRAQLRQILTYHVLPGRVPAAALQGTIQNLRTVEGGKVNVIGNRRGITVDGANVVRGDIDTSNGIIHVIDRVLMP